MNEEIKTLIAIRIGAMMNLVSDSDDLLAILATCLHVWAADRGEDLTALMALLMDVVIEANGLEIEGEGDNDT